MLVGKEHELTNESRNSIIRILGSNLSNPEKGRIFLWTKAGWFERIESQSGDLTFVSIAQSEHLLRIRVSLEDPSTELVQLDPEYRKKVSAEFTGQSIPSDLEIYLAQERGRKNRLLRTAGLSLIIVGLLLLGAGIYFRLAYSPANFQASDYKLLFRQAYYGGLSGIVVGITMDVFGWIIMGLTSVGKQSV